MQGVMVITLRTGSIELNNRFIKFNISEMVIIWEEIARTLYEFQVMNIKTE